jgi:thiol-disulfide isomerase/thioredoxin
MRVLLIVLLSLGYGVSTFAQKDIKIRQLNIGDTIPNLAFGKIVNNKGIGKRFKDLHGKPVILDFWAIFCGPCIKELPRYTALQRKFKDSLLILPVSERVNREDEAAVLQFFAKRTDINLPSVVEDETLGQFFPHRMIPHEVWIDGNGVVRAITKGEDLNEENIRRFIKGEQIVFKKKNDNLDYDAGKPLLVNGNGGNDSNFLYRSLISPMLDGLPSGYSYKRTPGGSCIITNYTMLMLYYCVYTMQRNLVNFNVRCVVIDSGSTSSTLPANYSTQGPWSWDNQDKYCYNLILPKQVSDSVFFRQYMLDDLNRFFGYQGRIEKRVLPSLVIVKSDTQDFSTIKANKDSSARIFWQDGQLSKMQNKSFDEVVNMLRIFPDTPPIINQTGYHLEKVTMDLGIDYSRNDAWNNPMDLNAVRKVLQRYGFDIVERNDLPVEVLVLSKNP